MLSRRAANRSGLLNRWIALDLPPYERERLVVKLHHPLQVGVVAELDAGNARASEAWLLGSLIAAPCAASALKLSCVWIRGFEFPIVRLRKASA